MYLVKLVSIIVAVIAMTPESVEGQWQWLSNNQDTPEEYQQANGPSKVPREPATPCTPNPCLHAGVCKAEGESDFTCECVTPLMGKTCEDLPAQCRGSQQLDKIVCMSSLAKGFDEDQKLCKKDNFEGLVTIKNQKTFDFIKNYITSSYSDFGVVVEEINHLFETGLKRDTAGDNKFKFPDNTTTDDSFNLWTNPSDANNGDCVYISTKDTIKFYAGTCDGMIESEEVVYIICEKKYPVAAAN